DPEGDGIATAHHELGDLARVTAEGRLLIDEQLLDDVVAQVEPRARHGPEGVAHGADVGQEQLALPLGIEEIGEALGLSLVEIGGDGDAGATHGAEAVGEGAILHHGEAALVSAFPARVVRDLREHENGPYGIPHAGRAQHLERGARGNGRDVPGVEAGLALLKDARSEVLRMEARVLELDVRVGLSEGLEGPLVAVAGEGVDDDLAFLFGRGDYQRPVRGGGGAPGAGGAPQVAGAGAPGPHPSPPGPPRLEEPAPADPGRARYDVAVFASR